MSSISREAFRYGFPEWATLRRSLGQDAFFSSFSAIYIDQEPGLSGLSFYVCLRTTRRRCTFIISVSREISTLAKATTTGPIQPGTAHRNYIKTRPRAILKELRRYERPLLLRLGLKWRWKRSLGPAEWTGCSTMQSTFVNHNQGQLGFIAELQVLRSHGKPLRGALRA